MCDEGREGTLGGHGVEIQCNDTALDSTDKQVFLLINPLFFLFIYLFFRGEIFSLYTETLL